MRVRLLSRLLIAVIAFPPMALAHHSFAAFDQQKEQTVTGTVKKWEWTNPHVFMTLTVSGAQGETVDYLIEASNPSRWLRDGWTRNVVKVGDVVKVQFHPRRDGSPGGNFMDVTSVDGKSLKVARPEPESK